MSRWNELNYDYEEPPVRPRARPGGGLLANLARLSFVLGALALVGGGVWLGFHHASTTTDESGLPLIKADPRPLKVPPKQPGGEVVPNQDKLVFDRLDPEDAPPMVERLLPPPETPLPRPVAPPPAAGAQPTAPAADGTAGGARTLPESALMPPPIPVPGPTPLSPASPPPAGKTAPASKPPPAAAAGAPPRPAAAAAPKPSAPADSHPAGPSASALAQAQAPATPAALAAPTGAGGHDHVQLASVHSEAEAREEGKRLQGRYHDILGGLSLTVIKADLGERGIYYRVQAGPVDEVRAHSICERLKSQNVGCQLVRH